MYELNQGTNRIVSALYNRIGDDAAISQIANVTNYLPDQLREDVQALHDTHTAAGAAQLTYNPTSERYELDGVGLHCGDALTVLVVNGLTGSMEWIDTRIEMDGNNEWYLVGLLGYQIGGLFGRIGG